MPRPSVYLTLVLAAGIGFSHPAHAEGPKPPRLDANGDPLPEGAIARLGQSRRKHEGHVNALAYSPDGKILASAGEDHMIRLWDAETDRRLRQLAGHEAEVICLAFSPDGKTLASGGEDKTIRFWDVATGKELSRIDKHPGAVLAIAYAADGKSLASGGRDEKGGDVCLWGTATRKELRRWKAYERWVVALAFSPDGKRLASAGKSQERKQAEVPADAVAIWDAATGTRLAACPGQVTFAWAVAFSPDGKTLASLGWDKKGDNTLSLRDAATGGELWGVGAPGLGTDPGCVVYAPDGKTIAIGDRNEIALWEVAVPKRLESIKDFDLAYPTRLAFSPDGKTLASVSHEGRVRLWDVARRKQRVPGAGHGENVKTVAVSPDGKTVVTGARDGACLWELSTGRLRRRLQPGEDVDFAAFAPDGKTLALTCRGEAITFWDPATGKPAGRIPTTPQRVSYIAFAPDGKSLVTGGGWGDGVYLWDVATRRKVREFPAVKESIGRPAFSPDGRTVATAGNALYLWDAVAGKEPRGLEGRAITIAFSPDGSLLAAGQAPMRLLEVATGQKVGQFDVNNAAPMTFSPDGEYLTALDGNQLRVFDVVTGREVRTVGERRLVGSCLACSPDGKALVVGATDCTALVWDVSGLADKSAKAAPKPEQLPALWDDITGDDRLKAYAARCRLGRSPELALPLLRKQLRPADAAEALGIARLIADLNADSFETREKATRELGELGAAAEKALRQALKGNPSAEVRRRADRLLARPGLARDAERTEWALRLLGRLGTPEARRLLEALAKGDPESPQTRGAKACLERLKGDGRAPR